MSKVADAHRVVFALRQHGQDMEQALKAELAVVAQLAARMMRAKAAKWRTTLTQSIDAHQVDDMTWEVKPGVDYAYYVENGVKPGGKGLPRFFDPASKSIVDWLQSKAFVGSPRVRKGTARFTAQEQELRDRYEGLAWHIRHKGTKAQPFAAPTAREMEPVMLRRMNLAVRRVLAARPDGGATA
ncbi:MAG: HK97 gp10 family phage protein [Rhodoferax sp.]|nr:HK97 gp10 family phage protein [Rhodoferax sp.]